MEELLKEVTARAQVWLDGNYDAETKAEVKKLMDADFNSLSFFIRSISFFTVSNLGLLSFFPFTTGAFKTCPVRGSKKKVNSRVKKRNFIISLKKKP